MKTPLALSWRLHLGVLVALTLSGCAAHLLDTYAPVAPNAAWLPPTPPPPWKATSNAPPFAHDAPVSLTELLDYALIHNPATEASWSAARAAAARLGSARSLYFPEIDVAGQIAAQHQTVSGGRFTFDSVSYGPQASLAWLLLDLGGREGTIDEAYQRLVAANLTHNAVIQDLVLAVSVAYYQAQAAQALVLAAQANYDDAQEQLAATAARRKSGLATIGDELQAKTTVSQAQLNLQTARGQAAVQAGVLASQVGLPASTPLALASLPQNLELTTVSQSVEALIQKAYATRPELARAQALTLASRAHVGAIRGRALPRLSLSANGSRSFFVDGSKPYGDSYGATLVLSFPLFTGFRDAFDILEAKEQEKSARAQADSVANEVALQVWTSYQTVQTAAERIAAAHALLTSAEQSFDVAQGRYKEGVGSWLDVLSAQSALATARAQDVQARAEWLIALAALSHDTGALLQSPNTPSTENQP